MYGLQASQRGTQKVTTGSVDSKALRFGKSSPRWLDLVGHRYPIPRIARRGDTTRIDGLESKTG
jgi:hypothetical protein